MQYLRYDGGMTARQSDELVENVDCFKYLGQFVTANREGNWEACGIVTKRVV